MTWQWLFVIVFLIWVYPSKTPSLRPSFSPSKSPSTTIPTFVPSSTPSKKPTFFPTYVPSKYPTKSPTGAPSKIPISSIPTKKPSLNPTTSRPTKNQPTRIPRIGTFFFISNTLLRLSAWRFLVGVRTGGGALFTPSFGAPSLCPTHFFPKDLH